MTPEPLYAIKVGGVYFRKGFGPKIELEFGMTALDEFVAPDWTIFTMNEVIKYLQEHKHNSYRHLDVHMIRVGWAFPK